MDDIANLENMMRSTGLIAVCSLVIAAGCSEGTTGENIPPQQDGSWDTSMTWDTTAPAHQDLSTPDLTDDLVWPDSSPPQEDADLPLDSGPPEDTMAAADAPVEPPADNDTCAAPAALTWTGVPITRKIDTSAATNDVELDPNNCTGDWTSGGDVFFEITLPPGDYEVSLIADPGLDPALYVLSSCSPSACVKGSDIIGAGLTESVVLSPETSSTYIIVVDAYGALQNGPSTLRIQTTVVSDGGVPDAAPTDAGPPQEASVDGGTPLADAATDVGPAGDGTTGLFSNKCEGCDLTLMDCTGQDGDYNCVPKSDSCTYTDGTLFRQCNCTGWQFCLPNDTWSTDCEPAGNNLFSCL